MTEQASSPVVANPNGFQDPYHGLAKEVKTRTTIDVSTAARADISAVYPKKGCLQTTINILIEKLRNELKRAGLTSYSPEQFERAIAQSHILLGGFQYTLKTPDGKPGLVLGGGATDPANRTYAVSGVPSGRVAGGRKSRKTTEAAH